MKFDKENILLNVNVKDKKELFAYIASYAKKKQIIDDQQRLIKAFINRESEVSTGLQKSFAIPHAKSNCIMEPTVLYLKLLHPIEWETFDNEPVQNIFALLVPIKYEGTLHLEMISRIATSLLDDEFIMVVKNSSNIDELEKTIVSAMKGDN
ncbi:PTS system IIA component, Fru family [Streptococcus equinus]|uniref:PTS sugar transporter subunit IIA n=1 Tax=Streptococcus equinus TaxID=1335 RepID=UPI00088CC82C|nr:fructose PTS transporter subunit IIA [Streptococcus equinus]SDQ28383.1 PTS system IIA component, Fru family [Streptococcus equinus]